MTSSEYAVVALGWWAFSRVALDKRPRTAPRPREASRLRDLHASDGSDVVLSSLKESAQLESVKILNERNAQLAEVAPARLRTASDWFLSALHLLASVSTLEAWRELEERKDFVWANLKRLQSEDHVLDTMFQFVSDARAVLALLLVLSAASALLDRRVPSALHWERVAALALLPASASTLHTYTTVALLVSASLIHFVLGYGRQSVAFRWRAEGSGAVARAGARSKVLILTIGTRGDVQPFIALGQELQSRGSEVTICAFGKHRSLIERYGLRFAHAGVEEIEEESVKWRVATHLSQVMASSLPDFCENFILIGSAFHRAALESKADVIVATSLTQSFAFSIAESVICPVVVVKFAPDLPTRAFPPPGYEPSVGVINLLKWYHHWSLIAIASNKAGMGVAEDLFRTTVLRIPKLSGGLRLRQMSQVPTLNAFSGVLVPTPSDWPGTALTTGWWLASNAKVVNSKPLDPVVSTFLTRESEDQVIVCVTFGSMSPAADANGLIPMVLDAVSSGLEELAQRSGGNKVKGKVLIIRPKQKFAQSDLELERANLESLVIDEAPHELIFPRCTLVVHHGGAGTTGSVIEAFVPSIVVPVLLWTDQPMWGQLLELCGGGRLVSQPFGQTRTPTEVARARASFLGDVTRAVVELSSEASHIKCRELGERVRKERGVQTAADAVERVVSFFHAEDHTKAE